MMTSEAIWIQGKSCCGKTTRLVEIMLGNLSECNQFGQKPLILCMNQDSKKSLAGILCQLDVNSYQQKIRTPTALMLEDVFLFYPLICEQLNLKSTLPLRLLSETEQELATQLWQNFLPPELLSLLGGEYNCVRRILDFIQLASAGGIPSEKIPQRLYLAQIISDENLLDAIGDLILKWRKWCLNKGLLSYGLIYELYWRYLLPHPQYRSHLGKTYSGIYADDVDNYPAIMADLGKIFIQAQQPAVFTFNEQGKVRVGFNADPDYWLSLAQLCNIESVSVYQVSNLAECNSPIVEEVIDNHYPEGQKLNNFNTLKTNARGDLLTATGNYIAQAIASGIIKAGEIAIIAPGLDEVARYTLMDCFARRDIEYRFLQEQRPLISSALVRSILTLLPFLYQDLGRLLNKNMVTEMLVVLSQGKIDLVRAGLITDHCYYPDIESPQLLSVDNFPRWDRLTPASLEAYNLIRTSIENQHLQIKAGKYTFLMMIDEIIEQFFSRSNLNYTQASNLRGLTETVEHFWQVQQKLGNSNIQDIICQLTDLLRKGTISANPFPLDLDSSNGNEDAIVANTPLVIANIYQYRSSHLRHRWHFWLDAGSRIWSQNNGLFAADLFLHSWQPHLSPLENQRESEQDLLKRVINDLLARVEEKVFLCHSNLSTGGSEQMGKLLPLVEFVPLSQQIDREKLAPSHS